VESVGRWHAGRCAILSEEYLKGKSKGKRGERKMEEGRDGRGGQERGEIHHKIHKSAKDTKGFPVSCFVVFVVNYSVSGNSLRR
jgi:hypothetical protein